VYDAPSEAISRDLGADEKLLWWGQPPQGFMLRAVDAFLIPFSLLWGGFAIFWELGAIRMGAPPFFALFGVLFVLIGLYLIVGRFFFDAWQRGKTTYAVTSERVLIVTELFGRKIKSLSVQSLHDLSLTERSDGSGIITFGWTHPMYGWYEGTGWPGHQGAPRLEVASEARRVYDLIRSAQRTVKQAI
jgi:hypothetical protein